MLAPRASVNRMGAGHYENFPVASVLLPTLLRPAARAIHCFARAADDLAEEVDAPAARRLAQPAALQRQLDAIAARHEGQWPDLAVASRAHDLTLARLRGLLSGVARDVTVYRYAGFDAQLDCCGRFANPICRPLLALYKRADASACAQSDAICSALQRINFWQDVALALAARRAEASVSNSAWSSQAAEGFWSKSTPSAAMSSGTARRCAYAPGC